MKLPTILQQLLALPTAPFREGLVLDWLEQAVDPLRHVTWKYDKHDNLLVHYRNAPKSPTPIALVAHVDHPGFVATEMVTKKQLRAAFHGGVKAEYFDGARVRFWVDDKWVRGRILKLTKAPRVTHIPGWTRRPEEALIEVSRAVPPDSPGMWDLPDPKRKGDHVTARACDDLAGVGAMLAALQELSRKNAKGELYCLFTRAEEVGFVGALGAIKARTVPKRLPIISVETSSTLPSAPIGDGPILRVGDKAAIFDPSLIAFCNRVAKDLAGGRKKFQYQRKLMDGGTCEAVPFLSNGYAAAGICLALGNYHNMDTRRQKIGSEFVSLRDWESMVAWFVALAKDESGWERKHAPLRQQLDERFDKYAALLAT